jgi:hypothetical protein
VRVAPARSRGAGLFGSRLVASADFRDDPSWPAPRAEAAERVRRLASHHVGLDDALVARARTLTAKAGLQAFDALHLAAGAGCGCVAVTLLAS